MRLTIGLMFALSVIAITPGQAAEIKRLEDELMAPCCYTQTIREHMSEVAEQMREEVTEFVLEGRPEREILRYYKTRYGEAILAVPDGLAGQVVFAVPVAAFGFAMATLGWLRANRLRLDSMQRNGRQFAGVLQRNWATKRLVPCRIESSGAASHFGVAPYLHQRVVSDKRRYP